MPTSVDARTSAVASNVAVIIPAHNASATIGRALSSLRLQACIPGEVIVVDDHSTDDTDDIVRSRFPEVRVIAAAGRYAARARNLGVRETDLPIVAFLDADDVWYPRKLQLQLPLLGPDAAFVGGFAHYLSTSGELLGSYIRYRSFGEATADLRAAKAMPVPLGSVVLTRDRFNAAGGFDESFRRSQDFDFCVRVVGDGGEVRWPTEEIVLGYVLHGGSASARSYEEQFLAAELIRRRAGGRNLETTYDEWIGAPELARGMRLRARAGRHYRQAAVARGSGRRAAYVLNGISAAALDPVATITKLRGRRRNLADFRPLGLPPELRPLFHDPVEELSPRSQQLDPEARPK